MVVLSNRLSCLKCAIVCFALLPQSMGDIIEVVPDDIEVREGSTTNVSIRQRSANFGRIKRSWTAIIRFVHGDITVLEGTTTNLTIKRYFTETNVLLRAWWSIHTLGGNSYPYKDFLEYSGSVLFEIHQETAVFPLTVINDDHTEYIEKFRINLGKAYRHDIRIHDAITITVPPNDHPYGLFYIPERYRFVYLNELGNNRSQITVERKYGQLGGVTVFYRVMYRPSDRFVQELKDIQRADKDDFDYTKLEGALEFKWKESSKVINIDIKKDSVQEDNEYFEIRILKCNATVLYAAIGNVPVFIDQQQSHSTVVIVQDEHPCGLFSLWPPNKTLSENSVTTTIKVFRSSGYLGNVTVSMVVLAAEGNIKDRINVTFNETQQEIEVHVVLRKDSKDNRRDHVTTIYIDNLIVELKGTNITNDSQSWAEISQNSSCQFQFQFTISKPPKISIPTEVVTNKSDWNKMPKMPKRLRVVENDVVAWLLPLGIIVGGLITTLFVILISKYMHVPTGIPASNEEHTFEHKLIKEATNDLINNGELFTLEKLLNMYEEFCSEHENGSDIQTDFVLIREAKEKIALVRRGATEIAAEKETMELLKEAIERNDTSALEDILTKHELFLMNLKWITPKESSSDDKIVQQKHDLLKELVDEALQVSKCPVVEKSLDEYLQFVIEHKEKIVADQDLITRANDFIRKSQLHAYHQRLRHKLRGAIQKQDIGKVQAFLENYQVFVSENEQEIVPDKELCNEASAYVFPSNVQLESDEESAFTVPESVAHEISNEPPSGSPENLLENEIQEEVDQPRLDTSDAVTVEHSVPSEPSVEKNMMILGASDAAVEGQGESNKDPVMFETSDAVIEVQDLSIEAPVEEKILIQTALDAYLLWRKSTKENENLSCLSEDCDDFIKMLLELVHDNHDEQDAITRLFTGGTNIEVSKIAEIPNSFVELKSFVSNKPELFQSKSDILNTIDRASDFAKMLHRYGSLRCDLMKAVDAKAYDDLQATVAEYSQYISADKLENVADKQCLASAKQLIEDLENEIRRQNLMEEWSELGKKLKSIVLNGKAGLEKVHTDDVDAVTDDKICIERALEAYLQFTAKHEIESEGKDISEANVTLHELGLLIENMGTAITLKDNLSNVLCSSQEAVISSALQNYVEFIKSCKNKIVADKNLINQSQGAIRLIRLKDNLHEAWLSRDIKTLDLAIEEADKSLLEEKLEPDLGVARRLRDNLRRIEQLKSAILNLSRATMMEIRDYREPPKVVHDVMVAVLLVLGDAETETRDWATCQKLCCSVRTSTYPGLMKRVQEYNFKDLEPEIAARGEKILESFTEDDVNSVSHGAYVFYVWALNMCKQCLALVDYAPRPASRSRQHSLLSNKKRLSTDRRDSQP